MYSFYGGRPGNSFIIVTTYRSVNDMITQFKQGPNYTAVHYDEYVMINAVSKNDPDNGKIYRRGYEFTNKMGGAEYIGTIVGPSGKAPLFELGTISDINKKYNSLKIEDKERYSIRYKADSYEVKTGNLVPGKIDDEHYNDSISWACYSVRDEEGEDTTAYVGFIFPYTVIDFESSAVEPYKSGNYSDTSSVTRQDDREHPFYEKWHINIPNGIKGDAFKNLKVETASSTIQSYDGQTDDITNNRKVLVYDYYHYNNKQNGEPKKIYLGDYNMIENISMSDDGTITIDYSHDDNSVFNQKVKWITSVNLNTTNGKLTVNYNHGTAYTTDLDWINGVNIANDGTVTFNHTHNNDTVFSKKIKWCTGITINNDGTVTFKWNNGTQDTVFNNIIQWIDAVDLTDNGTLTVTYNIPDEEHPQEKKKQILSDSIQWIESVNLDEAGTLTVTYNTLDNESTENPKPNKQSIFQNAIKSITSINRAIDKDSLIGHKGRLYINYNDGSNDNVSLDSLSNISLNQETGEITAEWNNDENLTQQLGSINFIKDLTIDTSGTLLVKYSSISGGVTLDNDPGWFSLGKVAPYGNNTNMTVSRILRGKHFIDAIDNKTYLQFYIENVGLVRLTDVITVSGGTLIFYYNGAQVGNELSLANIPIIFQTPNEVGSNTLNTLNFKIELDNSEYPITPTGSSPHLVDIELKNVVINVERSSAADRVADLQDQQIQQQINQNTSGINNLTQTVAQINNNINSINNSITNFNTKNELKSLQITNNSSGVFNNTNFYIIGSGLNIYYNEYFAIIKGRITTAKKLNAGSTYYELLNLSGKIPHKFKVNSSQSVQFTAITEGHSGRDFYITDGCKLKWKDATFGWGQGKTINTQGNIQINWSEVVQIDVILPFDLSTAKP